jgi:hypothetical protein
MISSAAEAGRGGWEGATREGVGGGGGVWGGGGGPVGGGGSGRGPKGYFAAESGALALVGEGRTGEDKGGVR